MRIWEVEDNKAIPTDLVREQDFILRVRRLQRLGSSHLVVNLCLGQLEHAAQNHTLLEDLQSKIAQFAKVTNGAYADMSNGDVFIIWEEVSDAHLLTDRIIEAIFPTDRPKDVNEFLKIYHVPRDYTLLRERANHYVEVVQTSAVQGAESGPASALKSEAARGPLTAWSVDQIGKLLNDINIQRYARRQPIYHYKMAQPAGNPVWQPIADEYFISFDDLRRERFPKLEMITPEHLFMALCESLDHNLMVALAQNIGTILDKPVHLNLAVASIAGSGFAQFTHVVPISKRSNLTFELHRADLFQDFSITRNAIHALRHEGYKVALDAITPDIAAYVNLAAFDVDFIKINVSKDRAEQLWEPAIHKGLASLPPERLIFFRCDNEKALAAGLDFGVDKFQGWLIDDIQTKTR